jgi:hypothetical protein
VHVASFMDLPTRQIFRTTCRTLNHYIAQCHFAYRNTTIDQLEVIEQQLAQRSSDQISVDFVNPPLSFRLQAKRAVNFISRFVNIVSLNLLDVTSELNNIYEYGDENRLVAITSLTNIQRLAIQSDAATNIIPESFRGLTKLTVSRVSSTIEGKLPKFANLVDLSLPDCERTISIKNDHLTRLYIETHQDLSLRHYSLPFGLTALTNLKQLIVKHKFNSYPTLNIGNRLKMLEHLKLDVDSMPEDIALNTNLTRLELRCYKSSCDLNALTALTQLEIVSLDIKTMTKPFPFSCLTSLPLRSAHLSIAKLDNAEAVPHLNADILLHLGLEIDSNSKFKDHLTRLTNLESLTLTSSKLVSVTLTPLTRLTQLKLHKVQCIIVTPLKNLKVMSVFGNQRTLAGLDTLTNLENLECTLKPTEIDSISPLTRLQDLHLTVNGVIRQNFMAPLYHLTYLKVDTYNPPPISWQTTMTRLNYLDLTNCAIMMEDLQQLTALTNLTQLQVNFPPRGAPVLFTMTRLQRIQFTPAYLSPSLREQLMKKLPHFRL